MPVNIQQIQSGDDQNYDHNRQQLSTDSFKNISNNYSNFIDGSVRNFYTGITGCNKVTLKYKT